MAAPQVASWLPRTVYGSVAAVAPAGLGQLCAPAIAGTSAAVLFGVALPSTFVASADAAVLPALRGPAFRVTPKGEPKKGAPAGLKPFFGPLYPKQLVVCLGKNLAIRFMVLFNRYMVELLENERRAIEAEERGDQAPAPPPFPDPRPALVAGLRGFAREEMVMMTRRVYEYIAAWRLARPRAEALLLEPRAWIRDVLSLKLRGDALPHRFLAYTYVGLNALALYYLAEGTVALGYIAYSTLRPKARARSAGQKAMRITRHAALQAGRVSLMLVAASVGTAVGALATPAPRSLPMLVGHMGFEYAASFAANTAMAILLSGSD